MRGLWVALALLVLVVAGVVALAIRAMPGDDTPGAIAGTPVAGVTAGDGAQPQPQIAVPPVTPVEYLAITRDAARAINAAVPFSKLPNPPAARFRLALAEPDQSRAVDCLAAAVWYEAGDDAVGEQAVAQVVLNRLRHPAFPKTVCGVVFQGAERTTGCQFSFACDGALTRTPSPEAWSRARGTAMAALNGLVFAAVGYATHYHTDWVVPNWSSSVDKVAAVHTHLFFRWRGAAGRPGAFTGTRAGPEPMIEKLARLSPAHAGKLVLGDAALDDLADARIARPADAGVPTIAAAPPPPAPATMRGNTLARNDARAGLSVVRIAPDAAPGGLALMALDLCRARAGAPCTVVGFVGEPGAVVSDGVRTRWPDRAPDFYYFSDRTRGRETVYWNCARFPRPQAQCLPADFVPTG